MAKKSSKNTAQGHGFPVRVASGAAALDLQRCLLRGRGGEGRRNELMLGRET